MKFADFLCTIAILSFFIGLCFISDKKLEMVLMYLVPFVLITIGIIEDTFFNHHGGNDHDD